MTGDDMAQFVFYSLLLILVGAGVFAGRERLGTRVKQLLIWVLILGALVVAYDYRSELGDAGSRVSASLRPGTPIESTDASGNRTVTIARNDSHFRTSGNVNGAPTEFLVDTGATTVVLTYEAAAEAGLQPETLNFTIPVFTANGTTTAAPATLDSLSIGGIERNNIRVLVSDKGQLFDNLLGMNFLDTLDSYTVRGDKLVLTD